MVKTGVAETIGIVGTGLAGLTMAASLAPLDIPITLIGPAPVTDDDLRTTAILQPGVAFLKSLGLWQAVAKTATPLSVMELIDGTQRHVFAAQEIGQRAFGFNIGNAVLKAALSKNIAAAKHITWHKTLLHSAEAAANGWRLILRDKMRCNVTLAIGADGGNSLMRQAAGIALDEKDEHQSALVAVLQAAQGHANTSVEWYGSGGPITLVPMPQGKLALVWCDDTEILQEKMTQSSAALSRDITALTQSRFGKLTFISKPQLWPVRPQKARRLIAGHLALLGEAAHILPPIGAQGFNTSLHDIMALQNEIAKAQSRGLSVANPNLLQRYETTRRGNIATRWRGSNLLNDMIRAQSGPLHHLRRGGLRVVQHAPFIKRSIMTALLGQKKHNSGAFGLDPEAHANVAMDPRIKSEGPSRVKQHKRSV